MWCLCSRKDQIQWHFVWFKKHSSDANCNKQARNGNASLWSDKELIWEWFLLLESEQKFPCCDESFTDFKKQRKSETCGFNFAAEFPHVQQKFKSISCNIGKRCLSFQCDGEGCCVFNIDHCCYRMSVECNLRSTCGSFGIFLPLSLLLPPHNAYPLPYSQVTNT